MIDFATLQGLTIPEGVVTQITDASGRVLWMVQSGDKVVLQVEKITNNTYAGETTYTGEQFILLDIYPKTNGTVKVTYGGLTKTITDTSGAEKPNAQGVFFGTFNGVSDSVETPASGKLTIAGDYYAFGSKSFNYTNKFTKYCDCTISVLDSGVSTELPTYAFDTCKKLTSVRLNDSIVTLNESDKIGCRAFGGCTSLISITVSDDNQYYTTENGALFNKEKTVLIRCYDVVGEYVIPSSVKSILPLAFENCAELTGITFETIEGWNISNKSSNSLLVQNADVTDAANNVVLLTDTYVSYFWGRK